MSEDLAVTINSRKYDGSIRRSWPCRLIRREGQMIVFEGVFQTDVDHADLGRIKAGTVSLEFYWLDRWYNIFRFLEPDGSFRNYYCNINLPPTFDGATLDYTDLDIDVVAWPDKTYSVLDIDEFEANARVIGYPDEVRAGALKALEDVIDMIETGRLPVE